MIIRTKILILLKKTLNYDFCYSLTTNILRGIFLVTVNNLMLDNTSFLNEIRAKVM